MEGSRENPIKVLLIPSSDYLGHPFPQRHNHIFERLHDNENFQVHVINFTLFDRRKLTSRCIIHEVNLEVKTRNVAAYYLVNAPMICEEIIRVVKNESIDVVVASNLLPPLLFEVYRTLFKLRVPVVFDLQDYYPTSAAGYLGEIGSTKWVFSKGLFEIITNELIKRAEVVTVPGYALAGYTRRVGARRVCIVPNGISEIFLAKCDKVRAREKLGLNSAERVIGYIGSVEFWLDMEPLIKAIAEARRVGVDARLLIVGRDLHTGYSKKVKAWLDKHDVKSYTLWLDFVPHEYIPELAAALDIGAIPFDVSNPTAYYAAPNKMWEYLSQGATVASTPIPEALAYKSLVRIVRCWRDYFSLIKETELESLNCSEILKTRLWSASAAKMGEEIKTLVT
ncbi:MAG: glycosyltransferase [Thermofilaceae archaeon]|nr:glycosyltransferase [Thermofilaceae archaeon]